MLQAWHLLNISHFSLDSQTQFTVADKVETVYYGKENSVYAVSETWEAGVPENSWHLMQLKRETLKGSWVTCDQRSG